MTAAIVFLCGMPRSASTWLGRVLDSHSDIAVFGETDFWSRSYLEPADAAGYNARELERVLTMQLSKDWSATTGDDAPLQSLGADGYAAAVKTASEAAILPLQPVKLYRAIAAAIAKRTGASIVVDKTPGQILAVGLIHSALPDARYIATRREPFGFVASLTHRREGKGWLDWAPLRRLAYHPALTVVLWRRYARALLELRQQTGGMHLEVDLEDVETRPNDVVRMCSEYLDRDSAGFALPDTPVNSSFSAQDRKAPPVATGYWLSCLARPELEQLYPNASINRCGPVRILLSWLLLLPSCLAFTLYAPRPTNMLRYFANLFSGGRT